MTINVVVATYHAVVLGCDSLSSVVERAYFPFRRDAAPARDAEGNFIRDTDGNLTLPLRADQLVNAATNIVGGVQKMFLLHERHEAASVECSVAALTSGLATLNGIVIAELGQRFKRRCGARRHPFTTAGEVAAEFLAFVRPLWEEQVGFAAADAESRAQLAELDFMVAGYGPDDEYIKVFRVSVSQQTVVESFPDSDHCNAAWAGQSEAVASLLNGQSRSMMCNVNNWTGDAFDSMRASIVMSVLDQLEQLGVALPESIKLKLPMSMRPNASWEASGPTIDWANLPVQSAVDLVSMLVNAESGIQRFSAGIPGVGGRTRIGILRRGHAFLALNEPEIVHSHVGYNND